MSDEYSIMDVDNFFMRKKILICACLKYFRRIFDDMGHENSLLCAGWSPTFASAHASTQTRVCILKHLKKLNCGLWVVFVFSFIRQCILKSLQ